MATTGDDTPLFLDTNVLIYATVREAPEHETVRRFVENRLVEGRMLCISRQVLREYLAVLSRSRGEAQAVARETLLVWLTVWRDRCRVLDDTAPVMETLWRLYDQTPFGGKQVHDANIVATMLAYGLDTLVTANTSDFQRFAPPLTLIDPRRP